MRPTPSEQLRKDFGQRLAEVRVERDLSQEQLAAEAGVAARYIQAVEGGRQNVTLDTVAKLASALSVEVEELFKAPSATRPGRVRRNDGGQ